MKSRFAVGTLATFVAGVALTVPSTAQPALERIEPVTRVPFETGDTQSGQHGATTSAFSADGRYATWLSSSSAIRPGMADHNGAYDVFLTDLDGGGTRLVSHRPGEALRAGDGWSSGGLISADGRWVAYTSQADDLGGGYSYNSQVYLYDRDSDTNTLVTRNAAGSGPGNGSSTALAFSADGRYLALWSLASDLIAGITDDAGGSYDLFLWDRQSATFQLVSRRHDAPATTSPTGPSASGHYNGVEMTPDGRWLLYPSTSNTLVAGDSGNHKRILLFDRQSGVNILVSRTPANQSVTADLPQGLSSDGRFALFGSISSAGNMVPGATDTAAGSTDLFVFDRTTQAIELITRAAGASLTTGNRPSANGWLSDDGQTVYFLSEASNLVAGVSDTANRCDLFLRDRTAGVTSLLSLDPTNASAAANACDLIATQGAIVADGSSFVFSSDVPLVAGHSGSAHYLYRFDRDPEQWTLLSHAPGQPTQNQPVGLAALSPDGERALWTTSRPTALTGIGDGQARGSDLLIYDRGAGTAEVLNVAAFAGFETAAASSTGHGIVSDDGKLMAFTTSNPICGDPAVSPTVARACLLDRESGEMRLLSHRWDDPATLVPATGMRLLQISADGRYVLMHSNQAGLAPTDDPATCDVFLADTSLRTIELITPVAGSSTSAAGSSCQQIPTDVIPPRPARNPRLLSDDAARVVFTSSAENLQTQADDFNLATDVFLRDRQAGETRVLSRGVNGEPATANAASWAPEISGDGRYAIFVSRATNLIPGFVDNNGSFQPDLYLVDLASGALTLVSHAAGSAQQGSDHELAQTRYQISTDGRYVAFTSVAGNIGIGGVADFPRVFLFDRSTGQNTVVSTDAGLAGYSLLQSLSSDGRWVLYQNQMNVPDSSAIQSRLYLWDRVTATTRLIAASDQINGAMAETASGQLSSDGRRVLFTSTAGNVVPGVPERNFGRDLFLWDAATDAHFLVSRRLDGPLAEGNWPSPNLEVPQLTASGAFALFASTAGNLVEHDGNINGEDLFLAVFSDSLFADGFESGSTGAWAAAQP